VSRFAISARMLRHAQFETIKAYWRDPAPFEAEREREQARMNAEWDARVAKARAKKEQRDDAA
jgi:hypothetical protein